MIIGLPPVVLPLLAVLLLASTLGLAVFGIRRGTTSPSEIGRGLRNGALVALVLLLAVAAVVTLLTVGRPLLFDSAPGPGVALTLGLMLGAFVALGYLALGALVMVIGLSLRHSPRWATRDSWLVTPVVLVLGLAATGFALGLNELADRPITRAGSVELVIHGRQVGEVHARGQARCTLEGDNVAVHVGAGEGGVLRAVDGRLVMVQFGLLGGHEPMLALGLDDVTAESSRAAGPGLALDTGYSRNGGTLRFSGLAPFGPDDVEPDEAAAWSGTLTWQCPF